MAVNPSESTFSRETSSTVRDSTFPEILPLIFRERHIVLLAHVVHDSCSRNLSGAHNTKISESADFKAINVSNQSTPNLCFGVLLRSGPLMWARISGPWFA